ALLDEGASPALLDGAGKTALDIAKMQSRRLNSSTWSALPGLLPETESSSDQDEGFVPRRFIGLLHATEHAAVLTDQAGRRAFYVRVVWCPESAVRWGRRLWIATEGATTVMQLNGENFMRRDHRLDEDLATVAVVFCTTSGPPKIICQLKTYIQGNTKLQNDIVQVQFGSKPRHLGRVYPRCLLLTQLYLACHVPTMREVVGTSRWRRPPGHT
ncbi:hypothetical protein LX36DRAFT_592681, partial [Colletotrichum falcatum]